MKVMQWFRFLWNNQSHRVFLIKIFEITMWMKFFFDFFIPWVIGDSPRACITNRTFICIACGCWRRRFKWVPTRSWPNYIKNIRRWWLFPSFHCGFLLIHRIKAASAATSIILKKKVIGQRFIFRRHKYVISILFIRSTPPFVLL